MQRIRIPAFFARPAASLPPYRATTASMSTAVRELYVDENNGQLAYTKTIKWHAAMNFTPKPRNVPPYHYPIILTSVFIFTMYCAVIREENEYDSHFVRLTVRPAD